MANRRYDEAFALFDSNKDGKVSKAEFGAALKKLGRALNDKELNELMKKVDKDENGHVDKNEFYQMMDAQKANEKKNLKTAFNQFDKDGNGFISNSELKVTMKELGVDLTDQEVADMIKGADTNKDAKISFEEFEKMMANV